MPTELPLEVYLFWAIVIVVIIACCVFLFLWGASAIGEKSDVTMEEYFKKEIELRGKSNA